MIQSVVIPLFKMVCKTNNLFSTPVSETLFRMLQPILHAMVSIRCLVVVLVVCVVTNTSVVMLAVWIVMPIITTHYRALVAIVPHPHPFDQIHLVAVVGVVEVVNQIEEVVRYPSHLYRTVHDKVRTENHPDQQSVSVLRKNRLTMIHQSRISLLCDAHPGGRH